MNNKTLTTNTEFWEWVLDTLVNNVLKKSSNKKFPIEYFMLNFETSESSRIKEQIHQKLSWISSLTY